MPKGLWIHGLGANGKMLGKLLDSLLQNPVVILLILPQSAAQPYRAAKYG
jgi:hypothetical protein